MKMFDIMQLCYLQTCDVKQVFRSVIYKQL